MNYKDAVKDINNLGIDRHLGDVSQPLISATTDAQTAEGHYMT